jgi:outer membrane protein
MQPRKFLGWALAILFHAAAAQGQDSSGTGKMLTLQECVDIAVKNNILVETNEIARQTAQVNRNQAIDYLLPSITGNAQQAVYMGKSVNPVTYSYVNQTIGTGSYGLNANLLLFAGLQIQNSIKQYGYSFDASKLDLQQQKDNITLNVLVDYLQVLSNTDVLSQTREQAATDVRQLQRLEQQNSQGALSVPSDMYNLRGQVAADQGAIVTAISNLESSKITLFQVLNIPYDRRVQLESITPNPNIAQYGSDPDSIFQKALQILPGIKSVDLKVKASQRALAVARGVYFPTLSVFGGLSSNYSSAALNSIGGAITNQPTSNFVTVSGSTYYVYTPVQNFTSTKVPFGQQVSNDLNNSLGLSLNVTLLNGLRARNQVRQAKINLLSTEYQANNTKLTLQQTVELAYQNMLAAYGQFKSYLDQVAAYTESFRITEIRFNEGVINSDPYVLAKNNLDRAAISLTAAKYAYIFRTKILDYYQGTLIW